MRRILDDTDIRHELGNDEAGVMSQKATTEAISESVKEVPRSIERISAVEKRVSNIELAIIPPPFVADDSVAYAKAVPANALPYAEVNEIGGMCDVKDGALVSAPVAEVKSVGKNLFDESIFFNTSNWVLDPNFSTGTTAAWLELGVFPTGDYIFDADCKRTDLLGVYLYVQTEDIFGTSGMSASVYQNSRPSFEKRRLKLDKPTKCRFWVYFGSVTNNIATYVNLFENIRIVRGTTVEEAAFEPYKSVSLPIPEALRNLEGYGLGAGAVGNTIDFDNKTYVRKVGVVDLGTLTWWKEAFDDSTSGHVFGSYNLNKVIKKDTKNIACIYPYATYADIWWGRVDNVFFVSSTGGIHGRFTSYTNEASFKEAMSGVMLVYELAEPIIEDISDILPLDNYIEVFEGGIVYAENENKLDVPSSITYQIKEVGNES